MTINGSEDRFPRNWRILSILQVMLVSISVVMGAALNQLLLLLILLVGAASSVRALADWPQAAGPNHDYRVQGRGPTYFSATLDTCIKWRTSLPNTGESTPIVSGDRIFLTSHQTIRADAESGCEIYGLCFDASTGKELWRRELPATRVTDMASGFSDNTAASPVADGKYVCFVNVGGSIQTFDYAGNLIWQKTWVPFGRHHARQQEPILHNGNVIFLRTVAEGLSTEATTKEGAKHLGRGEEVWTRLHAYNLATGEVEWIAESASSVHSLSMLRKKNNGSSLILTGRGGGHQPPEEPYGLSLISGDNGKTIWDSAIAGYNAHQNAVFSDSFAEAFIGLEHHTFDLESGLSRQVLDLVENATYRLYEPNRDQYISVDSIDKSTNKRSRPITYHTNCLIDKYHYFRAHENHLIGRVDLARRKVEYLQVPVQVDRRETKEKLHWDRAIANDGRNRDGFIAYQDKRATLDGWGHVSAASPIVVGDYLYMPTMVGTIYVLRWNADQFTEESIVSISDLGPPGSTWSLSSLSYDKGRLYARTMKELICISDEVR